MKGALYGKVSHLSIQYEAVCILCCFSVTHAHGQLGMQEQRFAREAFRLDQERADGNVVVDASETPL